jgi:uncharacterized protein
MEKKIFDSHFNLVPNSADASVRNHVSVVIAKPTRVCNADCAYCSSPPLEEMGDGWEPEWNLDTFKRYFDKVFPVLIDGSYWIWHGGEPMLMGAQFYIDCYNYAKEVMEREGKLIRFSMQSNMLGYNEKWYDVFANVFEGSVSTSFDPDEYNRTIKGDPDVYARVFKKSLSRILDDGFRPMVLGVYSEQTAPLMHKMYDWSLSEGDRAFSLRFNYCNPSGRFESVGEAISPDTYAKYLIEVYDRWLVDNPNFTITPLDQMMKKLIGVDGDGHCPWTKKCGGRFIEIEPDGDIYNCSDFADIGKKYCFGNLDSGSSIEQILNSKPALLTKRRSINLPISCTNCEHFNDCEGGCMRDAVLYDHGLYGKFHYCRSWKMVFTRIKESILKGEADAVLTRYGLEPAKVKTKVIRDAKEYFNFTDEEIQDLMENGSKNKYGLGDNLKGGSQSNYSEKTGEFLPKKLEEDVVKPDFESVSVTSANKKLKTIKVVIE